MGKLHIKTAEAIYLNGRKTTLTAKSRKSRFYGNHSFSEGSPLRAYNNHETCCDSAVRIGDYLRLPTFNDPSDLVNGPVRFISQSFAPMKSYCSNHDGASANVWLWSERDKLYVRCTLQSGLSLNHENHENGAQP